MTNNREHIVDLIIQDVQQCYDQEQSRLHALAAHAQTEGEIRAAAGNLVEHILQRIFDSINKYYLGADIDSRVGSTDFLSKTIEYENELIIFDRIQVDRHVFARKKRVAFIENKTYLDSCYFDRALADFRKIAQALKQHHIDPSKIQFIVFAGQDAAAPKTLRAYEADFWEDTKYLTKGKGIKPKVFFFLQGKRKSSLPLYNYKHPLNIPAIKDFINYILHFIKINEAHQ